MKNMERSGLIEGYSVKVNKEKLGKRTVAYVLIRSTPGADQNNILEAAAKHEEVEDMAAITGAFDIMLKVRVADTDELSEFLFKKVRNFKSVAQTETLITLNLKPYKESRKKDQGAAVTGV
jgi:Lrp/AsnC family leucine-responsive transcriptional regulator